MVLTPAPFDAVIPVAPKDAEKLPYVVARLAAYTDVQAVHVITPEPMAMQRNYCSANINGGAWALDMHFYADQDILPALDRTRFRYRPNWIWQQFAKTLGVVQSGWFLVTDADTLINHELAFFDHGHPVLYTNPDKGNIGQYLRFNQLMLGYPGQNQPSFISEVTFYNADLLRSLVQAVAGGREAFLERAVQIIDQDCFPAESEWYTAFVLRHHPHLYRVRTVNSCLGGHYGGAPYSREEIEERIAEVGPEPDLITIHTWE